MKISKLAMFLLLSVLLVPGVQSESLTKFKITDYIPEKFEDFQLTIDGNSIWESQNNDYTRRFDYQDADYDNLRIGFRLSGNYLTETSDKMLNFRFSSSLSAISRTNETFSENTNRDISSSTSSENSSKRFALSFNLNNKSYVAKDLFRDVTLRSSFTYSDVTSIRESFADNRFLDITGDTVTTSQRITSSYRDTDNISRNIDIDGTFQMGWGRRYIGVYSATANYFIKELENKNLLERDPTRKEMMALTKLIHHSRLEKSSDERLLRISTFRKIINYLIENNLLVQKQENMEPAFILEDFWDFFPRDRRYFGLEFRAGIRARWNNLSGQESTLNNQYSRIILYKYALANPSVQDTVSDIESRTIVLDGEKFSRDYGNSTALFSVIYDKPIDFNWHLTSSFKYETKLHFNSYNDFDRDNIDDPNIRDLKRDYKTDYNIRIDSKLSYIPTTRTRVDMSAGLVFSRVHFIDRLIRIQDITQKITTTEYSYKYRRFSLSLSSTYRVSIPTTLEASIYYSYNSGDTFSSNIFRNDSFVYVSASILHYIY